MHLHQADPDRLVGLLSLDDVDALLTSTAIRTPAVRVAQDGSVLPEASYTRSGSLAGKPLTGLVDPRRLFDLVDGGASVVLQGLQRYWPPLTRLVAELEAELGHPCQANAYLTPPGSQGFAVHSDSHDVFVFQTHGTKLWEVHHDGGVQDVLLEPGLVMYLPTGTPHAARAQESASLHVTVGINQLTWRHLVDRAVRPLLDAVDDGHLPAAYVDDPAALAERLAERLDALADAVRGLDADALARRQVEGFLASRPVSLAGGLRDRFALPDLTGDTVLGRRAGRPFRLVDPGEGRVRVLLGDRHLDVPARVRPALERVAASARLSPSDLHDLLDPGSALVLCRRLVREGALTVLP
ncbi:JmjC domain-containing protein [uncultured Nocardioides sp.]|uniref:cupin domain-containing protein n=1 Tax=uncultured Nocardioides sp. TaxID=198441 RepID=UPI003452337A